MTNYRIYDNGDKRGFKLFILFFVLMLGLALCSCSDMYEFTLNPENNTPFKDQAFKSALNVPEENYMYFRSNGCLETNSSLSTTCCDGMWSATEDSLFFHNTFPTAYVWEDMGDYVLLENDSASVKLFYSDKPSKCE